MSGTTAGRLLISAVQGLAGALWVPLNGLTTPEICIGDSGRDRLLHRAGRLQDFRRPIVARGGLNYLKTFAVVHRLWQLFMGVVLVTLVLALPTGIMGMVARLSQKWSQKGKGAPAP